MQELLEIVGMPYTGSGVLACMRSHGQGADEAPARAGGHPDAGLLRLQRGRVPGVRRRRRAAGDRGAARVSAGREAGGTGIGARDQVRGLARGRARGTGGGVQLRRPRAARAVRQGPRAGGRAARGRTTGVEALPIVEAKPKQRSTSSTSRPATRSGRPTTRARRTCPRTSPRGRRSWPSSTYRLLGCYGFARVDMILPTDGEPQVLEAQAIPGLTETSLLSAGGRSGGHLVRASWSSASWSWRSERTAPPAASQPAVDAA